MNKSLDSERSADPPADHETAPRVTDAPAEIGDTSDLAESERLDEDRARRAALHRPELPDRAFDRITPQV